jgi:hypothetical protein
MMAAKKILLIAVLTSLVLMPSAIVGGAQISEVETDNTVSLIQVGPEGDARWTIQIRTRLDTPEAVAGFDAATSGIETGDTEAAELFERRMRSVVSAASSDTGRTMAATNFSVDTHIQEVPQRWGVVSYSFMWEGFAREEGQRLVVGDAFDEGFFIDKQEVLEISAPEGYAVTTVSPTTEDRDSGSVAWSGRIDFAKDRPRVVFAPASATPAEDLGSLILVLVILSTLFGAILVWRRRYNIVRTVTEGGKTPEEQVLQVLKQHEGRMRQQILASELGWTASKTSRVLTRMDKAGDINKLQLGRENIISLDD